MHCTGAALRAPGQPAPLQAAAAVKELPPPPLPAPPGTGPDHQAAIPPHPPPQPPPQPINCILVPGAISQYWPDSALQPLRAGQKNPPGEKIQDREPGAGLAAVKEAHFCSPHPLLRPGQASALGFTLYLGFVSASALLQTDSYPRKWTFHTLSCFHLYYSTG